MEAGIGMKKILVTPRSFGKASREAFEMLEQAGFEAVVNPYGRIMTEEEMVDSIPGMDALIVGVDPVTKAVIDAADKLKVISKYGVGLDNVDVEYAKSKGIAVTITAGANTEAVADFAFTLMLSAARNVLPIDKRCRSLDWGKVTTLGVYGKTVGILGTGAIGKAVARRAKGFDMKLLAYDVYKDEDFAKKTGMVYTDVETILKEADFISIHLPLTDETRGMIGEAELSMMKPTAVIVNTARGGIIGEQALYEALKEKRIWGAGLDVFEKEPPEGNPLLTLDNIVIGSHCAASNFDAVNNMSLFAAKNAIEKLK
jgi:D-3-phosphoglycerate dehydrogenase